MVKLSDNLIKKGGIKFLIVNSKEEELINLLSEALNAISYIIDDDSAIIFVNKFEIEVKDLVDNINQDAEKLIEVYESNRIYSNDDFETLVNLVKECAIHKSYINNIDLIYKLSENAKNYRNLFLGRIALNKEMEQFIVLFLENDLNASLSAKNGFLHRNTVNYKLEQIKDETGLDIRRFKDAVSIYQILR